jgi:hypothetical protein
MTIPGRPAPEPISTTRTPCGMIVVIGMQLAIWRSQIRSPSFGPINPRSIPVPAQKLGVLLDLILSAFKVGEKLWGGFHVKLKFKLEELQHSDLDLHPQIR